MPTTVHIVGSTDAERQVLMNRIGAEGVVTVPADNPSPPDTDSLTSGMPASDIASMLTAAGITHAVDGDLITIT